MTFEEAKKILKKEGFYVEKATRPCAISESFIEYEDPTICEAMQVVNSAGYGISMESSRFDERKARLKKELEEHGNAPMPGPGEKQSKEKKGIIYPSTSPKVDFYYKHVLKEGNPVLEEAASQFNDALLDEQGKKIKHLTKKIARLNKIIHKKNLKIEEFRKESSRHLRGKIKMFGETVDLSQELCDKNEDIRLSKIREKNLTEVCQKYVKENEKLKKELAEKIVDKIDAQALKSAESALAYKENVIAEKDEVIADLGKELAATKKELKAKRALVIHITKIRDSAKINLKLREKECEKLKEALEEKTKLVEMVRNASKEYCNYGVAANEFIKELASLYVIANNKGIINDEMLERCKNYQTYGFPANCNRETKKEINDIARGNENKKPSLFRDDSVGAVTNQKDCSPAKDTHPTEDNPEEVELDEILECVRKALEKGHTVSIDYDKAEEGGDQSVTIVQCDNGIILSKEEAEIIERCTKNGTELHYSEKDGLTYTNVFGEEMPISCLRGMFQVFTDEEIKNLKK